MAARSRRNRLPVHPLGTLVSLPKGRGLCGEDSIETEVAAEDGATIANPNRGSSFTFLPAGWCEWDELGTE